MLIKAPAKIHLSGEHAVVYHQPAIAIAVDRYVSAAITRTPEKIITITEHGMQSIAGDEIFFLHQHLLDQYQAFQRGTIAVNNIMRGANELIFFIIAEYCKTCGVSLDGGMQIKIDSAIPIGCGMGASAAIILSVLYGLEHQFKQQLTAKQLFAMALAAEKLQHGNTTGFDLQVCQRGGCVEYNNQAIVQRPLLNMPFYLVNTGRPESTTGECVAAVAKRFVNNTIWRCFAEATQQVGVAIATKDRDRLQRAISFNHKLLADIGVVSDRVQRFIDKIELAGGAAKISGAGSVTGDAAGVVLVFIENQAALEKLVTDFSYDLLSAEITENGVTTRV